MPYNDVAAHYEYIPGQIELSIISDALMDTLQEILLYASNMAKMWQRKIIDGQRAFRVWVSQPQDFEIAPRPRYIYLIGVVLLLFIVTVSPVLLSSSSTGHMPSTGLPLNNTTVTPVRQEVVPWHDHGNSQVAAAAEGCLLEKETTRFTGNAPGASNIFDFLCSRREAFHSVIAFNLCTHYSSSLSQRPIPEDVDDYNRILYLVERCTVFLSDPPSAEMYQMLFLVDGEQRYHRAERVRDICYKIWERSMTE